MINTYASSTDIQTAKGTRADQNDNNDADNGYYYEDSESEVTARAESDETQSSKEARGCQKHHTHQ